MSDKRRFGYKPSDRLTRRETANVLGISVSMLAHLRRKGVIVQEKNPVTGAVRFPYAEVARVKAEREANGSAETGHVAPPPVRKGGSR